MNEIFSGKAPLLHSKYNPQAEASRYLDAVPSIKNPKFIVVTEPGESFLAEELRKRYPKAKICAVRYQGEFYNETDTLWDFCWRPGHETLEHFLFNIIPDEYIPLTVFLPWKPAEKFWPETAGYAWKSIASNIRLQQNIMNTRAAFGRKWLKNIVRNAALTEKIIPFPEISKPPLIVASGASLEDIPDNILENISSGFFICALSSASEFLSSHRINPDICISTDGGYWAGRLFNLTGKTVPAAFPLEAYIPVNVLEENPCVMLNYGSTIENEFFGMFGIRAEKAVRNGTVSGTAAMLFLTKTPGDVFAAGLDLKSGPGFSHARPHPFSPESSGACFRLSTLESKIAEANTGSSLGIYRDWFKHMGKENSARFFRIQSGDGAPDALGGIKTITFLEAGQRIKKPATVPGPQSIPAEPLPSLHMSKRERKEKTIQWLFSCAEKIGGDISIEEFDSGKTEAEILKLYSYRDYIGVLKSFAEGNGGEKKQKEELCSEASQFLKFLGEKLIGNSKHL